MVGAWNRMISEVPPTPTILGLYDSVKFTAQKLINTAHCDVFIIFDLCFIEFFCIVHHGHSHAESSPRKLVAKQIPLLYLVLWFSLWYEAH